MRKISLVAVLGLLFTIPFPTLANAACTQTAIVASGSVTLCLNAPKSSSTPSTSTKTVTNVKPPPVASFPQTLLKKPSCPKTVSNSNALAQAILSGCTAPKVVVPTPVAGSKTTTSTTTKTTTTIASDSAAFTPNSISIVTALLQYQVGTAAIFSTNAITHDRNAIVMGSAAQVHFVPWEYRWYLDGAFVSSSSVAVISFSTEGVHTVSLEVDYDASYRFNLDAVFTYAGLITVSDSLDITAVAVPVVVVVTKPPPHLVSGTCSLVPSKYRC